MRGIRGPQSQSVESPRSSSSGGDDGSFDVMESGEEWTGLLVISRQMKYMNLIYYPSQPIIILSIISSYN